MTILFAAALFFFAPMMFKGSPPFRLIILCVNILIVYSAWESYKSVFRDMRAKRRYRKSQKK